MSHMPLKRMKILYVWVRSGWFSSVQSLSHVQLFATPCITAYQASLSITNSQSLLRLMPIELVMPSSHLILCCPLLLLPPIPPSIRVFSNESTLCMRWPKYWSFSFSISSSNEHPGLVSFRMDWLDLLAVQETLKSLLQHHNSKASIFRPGLVKSKSILQLNCILYSVSSWDKLQTTQKSFDEYTSTEWKTTQQQHAWFSKALCWVKKPDSKESKQNESMYMTF